MLQEFLKGKKVSITKYGFIAPLVNENLREKKPHHPLLEEQLKSTANPFWSPETTGSTSCSKCCVFNVIL